MRAAFTNQGEICLCGSRVLIERSIYARFRDAFVERVARLRVGDPEDANTDQGAIVSEAHLDKVLRAVARARELGGRILSGGERARVAGERCRDGWFMQPTVIEGLPPECETNQEEIFGPVVTLLPFEDEAEALRIANGTPYGLAATIWSRDIHRCHRLAARLESGLVWVNYLDAARPAHADRRRQAVGAGARRRPRSDAFLHRTAQCVREVLKAWPMSSVILSPRAPEALGPYPHARRVGNLLFLSGIGPRVRGEQGDRRASMLDAQGA